MKKKYNSNKKRNENTEKILVKRLSKTAYLPEYAMSNDLAFDIRANESITINPYEQKEIKTGLAIKIPEGYIGILRDRAGIVTELLLHVVAGTFPPSYSGELSIFMINLGKSEVRIERGMKIAQMIVIPIKRLEIKEVSSLPKTERSKKKFFSTGLR